MIPKALRFLHEPKQYYPKLFPIRPNSLEWRALQRSETFKDFQIQTDLKLLQSRI